MTIATQSSKVNYQGNGVTTEFQIPFPFLEEEDIYIQKQLDDTNIVNLTYGTDYSVTGAGNASGGTVVLTTAPSASEVISVYRSVPLTQEVDYRENEIFPAETHEEALDKLTMEVQQLQEQADRAIRISRFSDADPETVVTQVERIYDSIDNVDIVADNISDITTVSANTSNVTTVAGNIDSVNNVAEIKDNVIAVDNNKANINTVAANVEDVVMVAGIKDAVTNVSNIMDAVVGVNNNKDNINAVNANKDNIDTVASNIDTISQAITSAQEAKVSEENAKKSEVNAKESEVNAKTSEENAKYFYEHSQTLGNIVQIEKQASAANPVLNITFEKVCSEKQFLNVYVDRVKLLPSEYTLADNGLSVTLSNPVTEEVSVLVEYFVGMSNTVAEDLQEEISKSSTSNRLQDCILSNPNLLQYTLTGSTLIIKAGSKIIVPTGVGNFNEITLYGDISSTIPTGEKLLYTDGGDLYYIEEGHVFAQATAPNAYEQMLWFDTTENKIKYSGDTGANWTGLYAFPLAIVNENGVKECFCNGINHFANCVWVAKGTTISIPNGKNSDGSFKNTIYASDTVYYMTFDDTKQGFILLGPSGLSYSGSVEIGNSNVVITDDSDSFNGAPIASLNVETGRVTEFHDRPILKFLTQEDNLSTEYEIISLSDVTYLQADKIYSITVLSPRANTAKFKLPFVPEDLKEHQIKIYYFAAEDGKLDLTESGVYFVDGEVPDVSEVGALYEIIYTSHFNISQGGIWTCGVIKYKLAGA